MTVTAFVPTLGELDVNTVRLFIMSEGVLPTLGADIPTMLAGSPYDENTEIQEMPVQTVRLIALGRYLMKDRCYVYGMRVGEHRLQSSNGEEGPRYGQPTTEKI